MVPSDSGLFVAAAAVRQGRSIMAGTWKGPRRLGWLGLGLCLLASVGCITVQIGGNNEPPPSATTSRPVETVAPPPGFVHPANYVPPPAGPTRPVSFTEVPVS